MIRKLFTLFRDLLICTIILILLYNFDKVMYKSKEQFKKTDTVLTIRKINKERDTDTVILKHTNYK